MSYKAEAIFKEIDDPHDRWCDSGHEAPVTFKRAGPGSPAEPTKFFRVNVKGKDHGVFCEPCLVVANALASKKRKELNGS